MASSNHAIKGSGGDYCTHCSSPIGEAVRVQPCNIDGTKWCPRCFVWTRMNQPSEQGTDGAPRFNAGQACVAKCQFVQCGWVAVCFGAPAGGRLMCGHCGRQGAIRMQLKNDMFTKDELEAIRETTMAGLKEASKA